MAMRRRNVVDAIDEGTLDFWQQTSDFWQVSPDPPSSEAAATGGNPSRAALTGSDGTGSNRSTPSFAAASTGLQINLIADDSVANAPAGFTTAMQTAAAILEAAFSDPITINIRYGWGSYDNVADPALIGGDFAYADALASDVVPYDTLRSWLVADATTAHDTAALNSLPASSASFPNGNNDFFVASAQERALGHFAGASETVDGAIAFGTAVGSSSWVAVALHEMTHALGRVTLFYETAPTILDMFRYGAAGAFEWSETKSSAAPSYLSIDGGVSRIADFGQTSDYGDFLNSGVQGPNDPFNEFFGGNTYATLTGADIATLDVIGFDPVPPPPDDYPADATTTGFVPINGFALGTLETLGDHDWFRVQLIAGNSYTISLLGQTAGVGTLEDPYLRLRDSNGVQVAFNDDIVTGINRDSRLTYVAPSTGTYYIDAGAWNEGYTGTYRASVSVAPVDDYSADTSTTGVVAVNGSISGNLEVAGDHDWFRVQLLQGVSYIINLRGASANAGTLSDPFLRLYDSTSVLLASDDDSGGDLNSRISFTSSTTAAYYIDAGAHNDLYTGTYTVSVTAVDDYSADTSTTGVVAVNGSISGRLEVAGDHDWFRVQLLQGDSYIINLQGASANAGTLSDPFLRLYNSASMLLASDDDSGGNLNSRISFTSSTTAAYYIDAGAHNDLYTGTYTVSVTAVDDYSADTSTTGVVAVNGSTGGNLEVAGDHDWFRVQLVQGTSYTIDLRGASANAGTLSDPFLRLYNSASMLLASDDDSGGNLNSRIVFSATSSGAYYIDAGAHNDLYSGTYTVSVTARPPHGSDFNADGFSDALWRNDTSGAWAWSDVHNGLAWHDLGGSSTAYNLVGSGDLNGDGYSDAVWRNDTSGAWGWSDLQANVGHDLGGSSSAYRVVGVGDFNGDGASDVLWRNDTSGAWGWSDIHNNNGWHELGGSSTAYSVAGVGDFNGDGYSDVLWRNDSTGAWGWSDVHNNLAWHDLGGSSAAYKVVGVGDFNGDGSSDALWRNDMTGAWGWSDIKNGNAWHDLGGSSTAYNVVSVGGYSGDAYSDVLWRNNATGAWAWSDIHNGNAWHDLGGSSTAYHIV
jgi:hypothetical protein